MTSHLVFGATGAIGRFLLPKLCAAEGRIIAISRTGHAERDDGAVTWLRGDLFATIPAIPPVDAIYSLGPLDAFSDWFARNAQAFPTTRRIVAISSMSTQSKQRSIDTAERVLAARLRDAEEKLQAAARQSDIACTILRPTLIYGGGVDRSLAPLARFARRWRVLPIPFGASGLRQPVHADDLARACFDVRDAVATFGKTYALGGAERLRFDDMLARIAASQSRIVLPLRIPIPWVSMLARLFRRGAVAGAVSRLRVDLVADNASAMSDFGYDPRAFDARAILPTAS